MARAANTIPVYVELPPAVNEALRAQIERTGRTLKAEILDAIERHLAFPPPPPEPQPHIEPAPKKPRGRPRKNPK